MKKYHNFQIFSNLRFAAYRSLFFWMYQKRKGNRGFREALPSCIVKLVKKNFPKDPKDPKDYTGFIPKLPSKCVKPSVNYA